MSDNLPMPAGNGNGHVPAMVGPGDELEAWLAGRRATTLRAYRQDLDDFARHLGVATAAAAVELLLLGGAGEANRIGLGYRAALLARDLAPATIARRLAALRSMVKVARQIGRINWALDVESPRIEPYRDTTGPGLEGWRRMAAHLALLAENGNRRACRDLAIVRLLHDLGLRRGEVAALDREDLDLGEPPGIVQVIGKGKLEKERRSLNQPTHAALVGWLALRGDGPGPLFIQLDRAAIHRGWPDDGRISGQAIERLVKRLARQAGLSRVVRPHGLRHQGITRALDLTGGDVRRVQRFSRHAKIETVMRYDDARKDEAGAITRLLGEDGD